MKSYLFIFLLTCTLALNLTPKIKPPQSKNPVYSGYYRHQTDKKIYLRLEGKSFFELRVNLCASLKTIIGKFHVKDGQIILNLKKKDVLQLKQNTFSLRILPRDRLEFIENIACGPKKGDIFIKVKN